MENIKVGKNKMREDKRKDKTKDKNDYYRIGSKIFVLCLGFLLLIFIVDTLLGIFKLDHVGVTEDVLETVKTLLFTISGYLFGKSVNHNSKENSDENSENSDDSSKENSSENSENSDDNSKENSSENSENR